MSQSPQETAYNSYLDGNTVTDKQLLRDPNVVDNRFVDFFRQDQSVSDVDTSNLGTTKWSKITFFETLMTSTFHVHWGNYSPPSSGPGNVLLVQFRQTPTGYLLRHVGFDNVEEYEIDNPDYSLLNSNSLELKEGLVGTNIKRLGSKSYRNENLWVHELAKNGNIVARYYLVP